MTKVGWIFEAVNGKFQLLKISSKEKGGFSINVESHKKVNDSEEANNMVSKSTSMVCQNVIVQMKMVPIFLSLTVVQMDGTGMLNTANVLLVLLLIN